MFRTLITAGLVLLVSAWSSGRAQAVGFAAELVASGLDKPLYATHAPGDPGALYIVSQRDGGSGADLNRGSIIRHDLATGVQTSFLTVTGLDADTQGGLHSLAFHPDYQPGIVGSKMYIVALEPSGTPLLSTSTLQEWTLDVAGVPEFSRYLINLPGLQVNDATHAMDWVGFRPGAQGDERDWLYVTLGDGGKQADDSGYVNNAQKLDSLYGKVLRIDVGGGDDYPADANRNFGFTPTIYHGDDDAGDGVPGTTWPEVFYSGLRNPWRMSFDRATGDIWIGDVGFVSGEEVNYLPGGVMGYDASGAPALPGASAAAGVDFGWPRREGLNTGPGDDAGQVDPDGAGIRPDSIQPLYVHSRSGGPYSIISITGGYVYRGPNQHPGIQGKYLWGGFDFPKPTLFAGEIDENGQLVIDNITSQVVTSLSSQGLDLDQLSSFAEDAAGNVFFLNFGDECSGCTSETGWTGVLTRFNTGEVYRLVYVPDLMPGDFNVDGAVDAADYTVWRDNLGAAVGTLPNDIDGGVIGQPQYVTWKGNFGNTFSAGSSIELAALPEPTSALLLALVVTAAFLGRGRSTNRVPEPLARDRGRANPRVAA